MTIDSGKPVRTRIPGRALLVAAGALLAAGPLAAAEEEQRTTVTHIMDSNTDRVPLLTAFPTYPSIARRDRIEGHATVCFMIAKDGRIRKAKLRDTSHNIFRKPALRAIKKSTFEPLAPNQVLATAQTCRTYRFRLEPVLVDNEPG